MKIVSLQRAITGVAFILLSLGLSAHADTLDDIKKAGKIRIAIDLAIPPFGMTDDKMQPTGSDVDLARLLAKDLGVELEIVTTREFDAPLELVFDVLTKPEHVRNWFAPFTDVVTECSIDLRVGGNYHIVFVTEDGIECSFRGTYLEVEPPTRTVATWLFEGWPDADAVESVDLHETDGVTKLTMKLAFRDQAGRDHMTKSDGQEDSFNKMEDYLRSLLEQKETVSG